MKIENIIESMRTQSNQLESYFAALPDRERLVLLGDCLHQDWIVVSKWLNEERRGIFMTRKIGGSELF